MFVKKVYVFIRLHTCTGCSLKSLASNVYLCWHIGYMCQNTSFDPLLTEVFATLLVEWVSIWHGVCWGLNILGHIFTFQGTGSVTLWIHRWDLQLMQANSLSNERLQQIDAKCVGWRFTSNKYNVPHSYLACLVVYYMYYYPVVL